MTEPGPDAQLPPDRGRLAAGVMIILFGVLLLLDRVGVIDWADRAGWWPLLAIAFGVVRLTTDARGGLRSGVFFVLVGGWGLLNEFGVLRYDESWPLLLVIAGGTIVLGSLTRPGSPDVAPAAGVSDGSHDTWQARRLRRRTRRGHAPMTLLWILIVMGVVASVQGGRRQRNDRTDSDDVIQRSAVLGQSRTVSYASHLRRGRLTAVMGECDVDLTHAVVAPGEEAVVDVFASMGSVRLRVPNDWIVDIRVAPAFGSVRDFRIRSGASGAADEPAGVAGQSTRMVLRGFVMMGDVSIR